MDEDIAQPPGRLRIVCKQSPDEEEAELPLRMLFVGGFAGEDGRPVEDRDPVQVRRDTLGNVLQALAPRLDLTVTTAGSRTVRTSLAFRALSDFGPDAVAEQIPEVRALLVVRDALTALKRTGDTGALRAALESIEDAGMRQRLLATLGLAEA
jgi:type VI secretion system protein ImpB